MKRVAPGRTRKWESLARSSAGPAEKTRSPLTFDAGAEVECFDDLITALANADANSTFFTTGRFVHDHAECATEITKHGHEVGNHTWSHLDLTRQPDDAVRDEIMRTEGAIVQVSGQTPRPKFRAPYGLRDEHVLTGTRNFEKVSRF
jgi:peptidoglycan/xylan/chitin deacetylase (PgdA/CDA1 family)